jgi:ATP-dependent RNA helicase RhlB
VAAAQPIPVPVHATETSAPASGDVPRKSRRRRGGRNRRREGTATDAAGVSVARAGGERAPRADRPARESNTAPAEAAAYHRPSRQVMATAGKARDNAPAKKPGLLSRLTRLLTGR